MRTLWIVGCAVALLFCQGRAAEPEKPDPDVTWAELAKDFKAPLQPEAWAKQRPSVEQQAAFNKSLSTNAAWVADRAKAFYERFPEHSKAAEAKDKEKSFRMQAVRLQLAAEETSTNRTLPAEPAGDPEFNAKFEAAVARFKERNLKEGPLAAVDELDKAGRALNKEFPRQVEPWQMLLSAIEQFGPGPRSLDIYRYMAANGPPVLREKAAPEVRRGDMVGKPLTLAYKADDGREVDIRKLRGKVVLVDFWASWCGPCMAFMPELMNIYQFYNPKGFEVVAINFDDDCEDMKRYVRRTGMPWPQFCDGQKFDSVLNQQYMVRMIPSMFLVDKRGILRDIYAREGLPNKIEALLKEPN